MCFLRVIVDLLCPWDQIAHLNNYPITSVCFLQVTAFFSPHRSNAHHPSFFVAYIYVTLLFFNDSSHQAAKSSWSGNDPSFGPTLWAEQDPDFNANFPIHNKSSNPCVMLEATHPINWCNGQDVHKVSSA